MNLSKFRAIAFMLATGIILAACGGLGKMAKYAETVEYNLDPNPLIVRGDSVEVNLTGKFPGKYFNKKAMVELTPVLTYEGGSAPYEMVAFQGEDAAGNATVIPYEGGKNFSYSDKVAYTPDMKDSDLMLNILGKQGNKEKEFEPYKLADGVITTPFLVMSDDMPIMAKDQFQRITSHEAEAVINYLVNSSVVRSSELRDDDIKAIDAFLKEFGSNEDYQFKGAGIMAYASPEGELSLNENLADERASSAKAAVAKLMKKHKMEFDEDGFFNLMPKGEDWQGFKEKMEASDIADKDLILRILEMYSDVVKREEEIKNLAATYTEVAEKILPELRRSQITVNYDIVGRSDEEIIALARSANADTLSLEEMLYAATLTEDMNEKMAIYQKTSQTYPDDYRAYNNMGGIHLMKNDLAAASTMFAKAEEKSPSPIAKNNMAIVERLNGNRSEAMDLLEQAAGAGDEVNYNMGIIDIQNGDYSSAINNMKGYNTFNKALAQVLNGSNEAAMSTLNASDDKDSAMGLYLKAIIGARMNDATVVSNSLKSAFAIDGSLKEKAMNDLEFRNFQDALN
jgi:tetratricopeptide (TPR) repeat protein